MAKPINLAALRGFEAAARHLSFTKAAAELNVTPAAVSHAIRELELDLRVRLFERSSRVVRLTAAGETLSRAVAEGLGTIGRAVQRLRALDGRPKLMVTTSPSLAAKWLVPRLDGFLAQHPDVDVRIDVSQRLADFSEDGVDIAIRFGTGDYPGLVVERLFEETVFPVCSPNLLRSRHPLREPRDLRHHTLIHIEWDAQWATWPNWAMWLRAAGAPEVDTTRGLHLSQTSLALQAALDGHGVALGDSTLVADDLAARRLVRPFSMALRGPSQFAYHLVHAPRRSEEPLIKAFRKWILDEVAKTGVPDNTAVDTLAARRKARRRKRHGALSEAEDLS
ncbi:transcriptional regulator GcvA [Dongia deserti]|uniref:transcriptional regulator GcvA n=1 Tax=Dongia deserti TaxID=2268030 RepID=UPI000E657076|nr:transcriptional regulator GcvA [Dongia deserti]